MTVETTPILTLPQVAQMAEGDLHVAAVPREPSAREAFRSWTAADARHLRLGRMHMTEVSTDLSVISMVAQKGYGLEPKMRLRYDALEACLSSVAKAAAADGASVHMPRIGTGLAGGEWSVIEYLVRETLVAAGVGVVVYSLPGAPEQRRRATQLGLGLS